eukprot:scaffold2720_cov173-Amphora_coffeaeformis.AAC.11
MDCSNFRRNNENKRGVQTREQNYFLLLSTSILADLPNPFSVILDVFQSSNSGCIPPAFVDTTTVNGCVYAGM